ncbi:hypothetical protein BpHYR1_050073 [Brachionus plicatilis]|uniref:Uncharacterized protein n=1 Tax=Brachionus plicatilis TaxID=10195 RepID=A0A3M7PPT4_BRAPC|nr:hypothetical protein BpHYR1_050073 [Brachionus plicatilis]
MSVTYSVTKNASSISLGDLDKDSPNVSDWIDFESKQLCALSTLDAMLVIFKLDKKNKIYLMCVSSPIIGLIVLSMTL